MHTQVLLPTLVTGVLPPPPTFVHTTCWYYVHTTTSDPSNLYGAHITIFLPPPILLLLLIPVTNVPITTSLPSPVICIPIPPLPPPPPQLAMYTSLLLSPPSFPHNCLGTYNFPFPPTNTALPSSWVILTPWGYKQKNWLCDKHDTIFIFFF